jgi:hypothetical protein
LHPNQALFGRYYRFPMVFTQDLGIQYQPKFSTGDIDGWPTELMTPNRSPGFGTLLL